MLAWRIWYDDLTVYDSAVSGPDQAPALGVQAIAVADATVGRLILSRYDYYWWDAGRWWGGDLFGLWDYLARPGWKRILFGRSLSNEQFSEVMARALGDPELPAKSAWDEREARP